MKLILNDESMYTIDNRSTIFDIIMQKCKKYGVKALIDVHSPASHNSGHNYNLWYYEPTAEDCGGMAVGHFSKKQITWDDWKDSITWQRYMAWLVSGRA